MVPRPMPAVMVGQPFRRPDASSARENVVTSNVDADARESYSRIQ